MKRSFFPIIAGLAAAIIFYPPALAETLEEQLARMEAEIAGLKAKLALSEELREQIEKEIAELKQYIQEGEFKQLKGDPGQPGLPEPKRETGDRGSQGSPASELRLVPIQPSSSPSPGGEVASLAPITLDVKPILTPGKEQEVLVDLRKSRGLREVTALESGRIISEIPAKTYFFIWAMEMEISGGEVEQVFHEGKAQRFHRGSYTFEVHYVADDQILILGFVPEGEANQIARLDGASTKRVSLLPQPWGDAWNLISVPLHRVLQSKKREIDLAPNSKMYALDLVMR